MSLASWFVSRGRFRPLDALGIGYISIADYGLVLVTENTRLRAPNKGNRLSELFGFRGGFTNGSNGEPMASTPTFPSTECHASQSKRCLHRCCGSEKSYRDCGRIATHVIPTKFQTRPLTLKQISLGPDE